MAGPASAQPLDKRTLFTFSGPIAVPGVTRPAGQYFFRLADPNGGSKVVEVLNPKRRGRSICVATEDASTQSNSALFHGGQIEATLIPALSLLNRHHTQLSDAASGTDEAQRLGKGVRSLSEVGEEP